LKTFGRQAIASDAPPVKENAALKVASCTKLITSIAALQCVERGLIGLDDSVSDILPEVAKLEVIGSDDGGKTLTFTKANKHITIRQLLTHSSGLAYDGLSPLIVAHRKAQGLPESASYPISGTVAECYSNPLAFHPGEGWLYGPGLDWAGQLVRRLNNNISLEEYFVENIFKTVGAPAPYPTFNLSEHPDLKENLLECANRTPEGGLEPVFAPFGDLPKDEHGGSGLALTTQHYLAVMADLLGDNGKLLKPETIKQLFTPQFETGSPSQKGLEAWSLIFAPMTGGEVGMPGVNYGLGGLILTEGAPNVNIPKNTLMWGGFTNPVWQVNRERGIAGWIGVQQLPPSDPAFVALGNIFWKDFWSTF
jgi:CubicO group peptidase (beta-lactamase class C family)